MIPNFPDERNRSSSDSSDFLLPRVSQPHVNGEATTSSNENTAPPTESLSELKGLNLGRIEDSWAAIASAYKQPHQRLLVLDWIARYYKIPSGLFRKGFELWLSSGKGGAAQKPLP